MPDRERYKPLFCYGSIQPHGWNYESIRAAVEAVVERCITPGQLWWAGQEGSYPYAKFYRRHSSEIHGTVLMCDTKHIAWARTYAMEKGAGYELRPITVTTPKGPMTAYGWHYLGRTDPELLIPSGNWLYAIEELDELREQHEESGLAPEI